MAHSANYARAKKNAFFTNDALTRGWNSVIRSYKSMYEQNNYDLSIMMGEDGISIDMFDMEFVKANLPERFNEDGCLCTLKKYSNEEYTDMVTPKENDDEDTKKSREAFGALFVKQWDAYYKKVYFPTYKFSASSVYTLICQANRNRIRNANAKQSE